MDKSLLKNRLRENYSLLTIAILAILFQLVFRNSPYLILISVYIIIYTIAVSGLDILVGFSGQISMGHAAYYCIGAYGSVLLHKYTGIPVFFTMLIASAAATVIGSLIAWPTTKLVAHFMSLATIAFAQIVYQMVLKSPNRITGDANGISTAPISFFGYALDNYTKFFYFSLIVLIVFLVLKGNLLKSRVGRAMLAIRENNHAADGMGVNVRFYKIAAFAISVFFTAYAGSMFAHLTRYISPDSFKHSVSVMFLAMLLFGGTSSVFGPLIGAAAITVLNELLRPVSSYRMLAYGVVLLLVILAFPGGLAEVLKKPTAFIKAWVSSKIVGLKKNSKADKESEV